MRYALNDRQLPCCGVEPYLDSYNPEGLRLHTQDYYGLSPCHKFCDQGVQLWRVIPLELAESGVSHEVC